MGNCGVNVDGVILSKRMEIVGVRNFIPNETIFKLTGRNNREVLIQEITDNFEEIFILVD
jgi:hypothetical protein